MAELPDIVKIGTRGSPLALTQTKMVQAALTKAHPGLETEIVIIQTSGDWKPEDGETRLQADAGGKAQFAKEIEEALLSGAVDCAVHSMKDMETALPAGLQIAHMLPREDARDTLLINNLANNSQNLSTLPHGCVVGTASVRRQAFLLAQRPDLKIVPLRGNVQTRIEKLRSGQVDATLLALAGLKRLGLADEADVILEPEDMLPAAGQGAVGIETRTGDELAALFDDISCRETLLRVSAERAVLAVLNASCHTPIGVHAHFDGDVLYVRARAVSLDGRESFAEEVSGTVQTSEQALALGKNLGAALAACLPSGFLDQKIQDGL
ncbi:MAG: hydroxymethylbilane synthase [Alphaproteobacteria bacterium]|nr:hydroxymethylbilane synthase [Alphaproteobacteria bacterium]